jgi:hypothetical protein
VGVGAGANMTAMSDRPISASKPSSVRPDVGRMSLDVFMPENRLARKRAEARRRTIKRWLSRLLHRSPEATSD